VYGYVSPPKSLALHRQTLDLRSSTQVVFTLLSMISPRGSPSIDVEMGEVVETVL